MRTGKAEQSILRHSVIDRIRTRRAETLSRISEASDAACILTGGKTLAAAGTAAGKIPDPCCYAFYRAANNISAAKGEPLAMINTILMPEGTSRESLKAYTDRFEELAGTRGVDIAGGHTEVTKAVTETVISVSVIGRPLDGALPDLPAERFKTDDGLSVIMSGYAGCEGTSILAYNKAEELKKRFNGTFVSKAESLKDLVSVSEAAAVSCRTAPVILHDVSQGGILSALWDIAAAYDCGLDIDLGAVPIRQETVEICECFSLNPYELASAGALLIVTDEPEKIRNSLADQEIPAAVIGTVTNGKEKILRTRDLISCMNRPSKDALLLLPDDDSIK